MACSGSVPLTHKLGLDNSDQHTIYTAKGTVVHSMSEASILDHADIDQPSVLGDWCRDLPEYLAEEQVTDYMRAQAHLYIEEVNKLQTLGGYKIRIEHLSYHSDQLYGTADAVLTSENNKHLIIVDLKTGKQKVKAKENFQLMTYAGMTAMNLKIKPATVTLMIIQPTDVKSGVSVWVTDLKEIDQHMAKAERAMASAKFQRGRHCRYCPAKVQCTEGLEVLSKLEVPDMFRK